MVSPADCAFEGAQDARSVVLHTGGKALMVSTAVAVSLLGASVSWAQTAPGPNSGSDSGSNTAPGGSSGPQPASATSATTAADSFSEPFADRIVSDVRYEGLVSVPVQLVENATRVRAGDAYNRLAVEEDITRLTKLGRFSHVYAEAVVQPGDTVGVVFRLLELPILSDVQIIGSQAFAVEELRPLVLLRAGDPLDENLINDAIRRIKDKYESEGYFVADVSPDRQLLAETGILVLEVREGPQVKIHAIEFKGNTIFPDQALAGQIKTKPHIPIFRKGALRRDMLDIDDAAVRAYYQDRGYLDARVGSVPLISDDQKLAIVRFEIEEGPRYVVDQIRFQGADRFSEQQLLMRMSLKGGHVFDRKQLNESVESVRALYAQLGYLNTRVVADPPRFHQEGEKVDLVIRVDEGIRAKVGRVLIRNNAMTQDRVVLHRVRRIQPGRYFDQTGIEETERLLRQSGLFSEATVTVLGLPTDEYRDVVIEVKEMQTGSVLFSAGVSSDSGLIGGINISQRNFDITDPPNSWDELVSQRAFRGGGQSFNLAIEPGNQVSRYSLSLREPKFMDSDYSLGGTLQYYSREREDYDETRASFSLSAGKAFGDIWSGFLNFAPQTIKIDNIEDDAPVDVFEVEGNSFSDGIGVTLIRNTTDSPYFPTKGSRTEMGLDRFGLLGGDYDFTRLDFTYDRFWTMSRDYMGRPSVLRFEINTGYIPEDDAPVFDRFYAGGHRTFRGFDYRGIGPRGVRHDTGELGDDAVGGNWQFLTTVEYNFPIDPSGGDVLRMVVFSDMGTIQEDIGFDEWRVSIGTGVRIKLPFFGQAPFALDLAVPVIKEDTDETRLISFDLSLPFN